MKKFYSITMHPVSNAFLICFSVFFLFATGCKKDKSEEAGTFEIEGAPAQLLAPLEGVSQTYNVKAIGLWLIDVVDGQNWLTVSPKEGNGDGSFTVTVDKNRTGDKRKAALVFRSNFQRLPQILKIEQAENENPPYFNLVSGEMQLETDGHGTTKAIEVNSNTEWSIVIPDEVGWVHAEPAAGNANGSFNLRVDANPLYTARTANIRFVVDGLQMPEAFVVSQDGKVDETVVLNEDFNWLAYGSSIFYTTTGETRVDAWTQEQKDKGWTGSVNTIAGSGNTPLLYARQGFVKVGKTSYGGDLISPKLTAIEGTKNVQVSFKAVPYQTLAGARDGNILMVSVIGPGTVSTDRFVIGNWPDYAADPECTEIWKAADATRTFTITGATSETQIKFLGGDYDLRTPIDPNKNRIFLDDIVVTIK